MKKFTKITKKLITLALLFTIIIGQIPGGNTDDDSGSYIPQGSSPINGENEQ